MDLCNELCTSGWGQLAGHPSCAAKRLMLDIIWKLFYFVFIPGRGGRNSSVGSAWARCPQCHGFDPPLGTFSVEGIFPLELTWVQNPFPQKLLWMRV